MLYQGFQGPVPPTTDREELSSNDERSLEDSLVIPLVALPSLLALISAFIVATLGLCLSGFSASVVFSPPQRSRRRRVSVV